jgi:hypothetical protein
MIKNVTVRIAILKKYLETWKSQGKSVMRERSGNWFYNQFYNT